MEIGQFIEIAFTEPLISKGQGTPVEINVNINSQYADCSFNVSSPSIKDWNNTLNVIFQHNVTKQNIYFQIGKNKILGKDEINCYYEYYRMINNMKKGTYVYKGFEILGEDNKFKIDKMEKKEFFFYGIDTIQALIYSSYYVSQEGSKILFSHNYESEDDSLPSIFLYTGTYLQPLTRCEHLRTLSKLGIEFAFCEFTKDDINFIEKNRMSLLYYKYLCDYYDNSDINLRKLDTNNYPVFKVTQFISPNDTEITANTELIIEVNITGSIKYYQNDGKFYTIIDIENNDKNISSLALCSVEIASDNIKSNFSCYLYTNEKSFQFQNLYLLPYTLLAERTTPFEVFIKDTIKAREEYIPPGPGPDPPHTDTTDPTDSERNNQNNFARYLEYSVAMLFAELLFL